MFTPRCTHKLLRRGLTESPHGEVAPTTLLGDWYANVLVTRPQHQVQCISERTLLPVVVPAKSAGTLPILAALAIPPASVQAEYDHMREHRIGRTASKRVLGSLNELMFLLEHSLHSHPNGRTWCTRCGFRRRLASSSSTARQIAQRKRFSCRRRPSQGRGFRRTRDFAISVPRLARHFANRDPPALSR